MTIAISGDLRVLALEADMTPVPPAKCKGCNRFTVYQLMNGYCPDCVKETDAAWWEAEERQDRIGQNGNDGEHYPKGVTAPSILLKAREHLQDRAASRDSDGERSMARTVAIFNAATGLTMSEAEGWLFMLALKIARSQAGGYNADDFEDLTAYGALLGECTSRG